MISTSTVFRSILLRLLPLGSEYSCGCRGLELFISTSRCEFGVRGGDISEPLWGSGINATRLSLLCGEIADDLLVLVTLRGLDALFWKKMSAGSRGVLGRLKL